MNRPSRARSIWSISRRRAGQPRHHLGGGEPQHRRDVGVVGEPVDGGSGSQPVACSAATSSRAAASAASTRRPFVGAVLGQPERLAQAGHDVLAAEQLTGPQDGQHQVEFGFARGRLAEDVQAVADLDVLDLAQPAVDVQQHVVERVLFGPLGQAQVVVHLGGAHQRPDLLADGGQLAGSSAAMLACSSSSCSRRAMSP